MSFAKFAQAVLLLVVGLALIIAARPAQAQTETVLYAFCSAPGCTDGDYPDSRLTSDRAGNFYGTTGGGGAFGYGTVFELSPNGGGGWNESVLYSFTGGADGAYPWRFSNVIFDGVGNLYGTTAYGGANGLGVAFELSPVGTSWKETILHGFVGGTGDGSYPSGDLVIDLAGNVYGTTVAGGSAGGGIVFELSRSGGDWNEQVIYTSGLDNYGYNISGVGMAAGLTMDSVGNIYGANGDSVFELSPNGNGGWTPAVLHTFTGPVTQNALDSGAVGTPTLDQAGNVYGTTIVGGPWGIVYKLSPEKKGKWKEKAIHAFNGEERDGVSSAGTLLINADGDIYGVSFIIGGKDNVGDVFELIPQAGTGKYEHQTLWSFGGPGDGWLPSGGLIQDSAGNLYGTTTGGGSNYGGIVFEMTP